MTGADTENFKDWNKNHIKGKWVEVKYPIYEHSNNNNNKNKNKNKNKDKNQSGYWNLHTEICFVINKWQEKISSEIVTVYTIHKIVISLSLILVNKYGLRGLGVRINLSHIWLGGKSPEIV